MDDIREPQKMNKRHLRHAFLAREEYAQLIRRAKAMDKKSLYKDKQDLVYINVGHPS